jgi:HK97 gp10 family phage protein
VVSARLKNKVGMAEFGAALKAGLGIGAARSALRDARRAAGGGSFAEMYVGPSLGKGVLRYAHLQEFGTSNHAAHPFMRPAWDSEKDNALSIIRRELGNEIMAAARRVGRSKRYGADIKYRASTGRNDGLRGRLTMEEALIGYLLADSGVRALVGTPPATQRIHWTQAPQGVASPTPR